MATSSEVLSMLIPNGGYVQVGTEYEGIEFIECESITKKQYTDGFAQYDAWKAQQETTKAEAKSTLLERLGITAEEAALLLG